jgi:hypothetical protein
MARGGAAVPSDDDVGPSGPHALLDRTSARRADDIPSGRSADNWKRARIVGYTLGVIVVGVVAYVAYNVLTGT